MNSSNFARIDGESVLQYYKKSSTSSFKHWPEKKKDENYSRSEPFQVDYANNNPLSSSNGEVGTRKMKRTVKIIIKEFQNNTAIPDNRDNYFKLDSSIKKVSSNSNSKSNGDRSLLMAEAAASIDQKKKVDSFNTWKREKQREKEMEAKKIDQKARQSQISQLKREEKSQAAYKEWLANKKKETQVEKPNANSENLKHNAHSKSDAKNDEAIENWLKLKALEHKEQKDRELEHIQALERERERKDKEHAKRVSEWRRQKNLSGWKRMEVIPAKHTKPFTTKSADPDEPDTTYSIDSYPEDRANAMGSVLISEEELSQPTPVKSEDSDLDYLYNNNRGAISSDGKNNVNIKNDRHFLIRMLRCPPSPHQKKRNGNGNGNNAPSSSSNTTSSIKSKNSQSISLKKSNNAGGGVLQHSPVSPPSLWQCHERLVHQFPEFCSKYPYLVPSAGVEFSRSGDHVV